MSKIVFKHEFVDATEPSNLMARNWRSSRLGNSQIDQPIRYLDNSSGAMRLFALIKWTHPTAFQPKAGFQTDRFEPQSALPSSAIAPEPNWWQFRFYC